ncbi:MAG: sporulation protein YabP [Oscillospiraceae bacterium]|nr:sporulation protein YabP [Oscillospiraceae bacterium]
MAQELGHGVRLEERRKLTATGVTEVLGFEETQVVLQTALGLLTVHGQELRLKNLSAEGGQVAVEGQIGALIYEETRQRGGWRRFFP